MNTEAPGQTFEPSKALAWMDLPKWVRRQAKWWAANKATLDLPEPEPVWGEDDLSKSMRRLYEALAERAKTSPPVPQWYEFDGDIAAQHVLEAWCEHLVCPECEESEAGDFGADWGTVECSDLDCEHVWRPEWVTPWAPATRKGSKSAAKRFDTGPCPICGRANRRLNPDGPYAFVCQPRRTSPSLQMHGNLFWTDEQANAYAETARRADEAWEEQYLASCLHTYREGHQGGWYRYSRVWLNFCHGCGALFAARLPDEGFCSRPCGPPPEKYTARLRRLAVAASPSIPRAAVFDRDGWTCHICSKPIARDAPSIFDRASIDHVVPIALGGTHTLDNVSTAHLRCNMAKSDLAPEGDEFLALQAELIAEASD